MAIRGWPATVALCLATTILLKTGIQRGRTALALITLIPLVWLLTVTGTAAVQKIWHEKPSIGFLAKAADLLAKDIPKAEAALAAAPRDIQKEQALKSARAQRTNNFINTGVTAAFLALVVIIVSLSVWEWLRLLRGTRKPDLAETEPVFISLDAPAPGHALGALALSALLLKEVSGEAAIERERIAQACECAKDPARARRNVFLSATERQFTSPNRCC